MAFSDFARRAGKLAADNSPAILTAIGVTGTLTTAYLTGKATFKAAEVIAENEHEFGNGLSFQMGSRDKVELVWKLYIPAASTAVLTVGAIVFANRIGTRRAAALAAAYSISERAIEEYKAKVVERMGVTKEQAVRDEIAQDRVKRNPVSREVIVTGKGEVLFYESFTGRYFTSTIQAMDSAVNEINAQIISDNYAALTDFYYKIGLAKTSMSDEVGWSAPTLLKVQYSTTIAEDERPCIVIDFEAGPIRDYDRFN